MSYSDSSDVASPLDPAPKSKPSKLGQEWVLRRILHAASLGAQVKRGLIPVAPVVVMTVASHGRATDRLRDRVITAFDIGSTGP